MTPVRCALVGYGMIGQVHARILRQTSDAEVVVVSDVDASLEQEVSEWTRFTTDVDEALEEPDLEAAWVCTPQHLHREIVTKALSKGLHVFCEKPMAASIEDAKVMIAASESEDDRLVIGHTLRFDPDYIAVKQAVDSGRLGEIVQMSARWNAPQHEGKIISGRTSVALEMMIHDLDIMRWIAGEIESVYGIAGRAVVGPGSDAAVAVVSFRSGAIAALDHNWIMADETAVRSDHRLAVFGSEGSAYVELRDTPAAVFASNRSDFVNTKYASFPNGIPSGALALEDAYFLRRVRDGRPWPLTLDDAFQAVLAAVAIDKSISQGIPLRLRDIDTQETQ